MAVSPAAACPFYQNLAPRVNYTTVGAALTAAFVNGVPVRVCDQAKILANETVPEIAQSVAVIGDVAGASRAYLTVEDLALSPVFAVTADSATFIDLHIVFKNQLFAVAGGGQLHLDHVRLYFGEVPVELALAAPGDTGLIGDHVQFVSTGVAVVRTAGELSCVDCDLVTLRDAGFVSRSGDFDGINTPDLTAVDVPVPYALQAAPGSPFIKVDVSEDYVDEISIINCKTYPETCPTADPAFGAGGGGNGCDCDSKTSTAVSILLTVTLTAGGIALIIYGVSRFRKRELGMENTFITVTHKKQ